MKPAEVRSLWIPGVDGTFAPALDVDDQWERIREAAEMANPALVLRVIKPGARSHYVHTSRWYVAVCGSYIGSTMPGDARRLCMACAVFVALHRPDQRRTVPRHHAPSRSR